MSYESYDTKYISQGLLAPETGRRRLSTRDGSSYVMRIEDGRWKMEERGERREYKHSERHPVCHDISSKRRVHHSLESFHCQSPSGI